MKIGFLVTSTIEVDNKVNFLYQPHLKRSFWTSEQRLQQTVETINSIKTYCPESDIFLLDSSRNFNNFQNLFNGINYVPIYSLNPEAIEITHKSRVKGLCESLILKTFIDNNFQKLHSYDYLIKITGRYQLFNNFNKDVLIQENLNKIFTKGISWVDIEKFKNTGYELFLNSDNKFPYVLTSLYGIGKHKFNAYFYAINKIINLYRNKNIDDVALETLFFSVLQHHINDFHTVQWEVIGKCGVTGETIYY